MNYIVSTIQYNAVVNKTLLKNMLVFADRHKVNKIFLFVMPGRNIEETSISKYLLDHPRIEFLQLGKEGMKLNNNLKLHDTAILASQINPLTGFNKKLHRDYSYILPSPKIRYQTFPNTSKYPRFLATTGALTHGNYKLHTAQGRKAELEHEYGFSFIEVKDNRLFDYHPVIAMKNGNFHYNRDYHKHGQVIDQQPEALVLGDWHNGDSCLKTRHVSFQMIKRLNPKRVVLHDFFNGHSINHHEMADQVAKVIQWKNQRFTLEQEVAECHKEMMVMSSKFPDQKFLVVESNHDLFLRKYISNNNFLLDGQNSVFACQLFIEVVKTNRPIHETALGLVGNLPSNFVFLKEDEEYRVQGIELGYHGHRGVNGARGTSASFDRNNLRMITGHEHSPKIYANGLVVGTSTKLRLPYTKGASSWLNAHGLLYSSGKYTLLTIIH